VKATEARRELGNILINGPTRCGKGLFLTEQLRQWPHSVVVNDIKGDLSELTADDRGKRGKVLFIDTRGVGNRYDPLLGRHTEDELRSSAEQLLFDSHEGDGAIFTKRAVKMLTQLFRGARIESYSPIPYAAHLIHLGPIEAAARLNTISERAQLPPEKNLATRFLDAAFADANFADRFLQSAWSTLTAKLDPIITETVIKSIAGSDFSPEELLSGQKPVTVYLRFPELHLHALSPLIRLIWSSLIEELCNAYDGYSPERRKNCRPVLLAIDEAGRAPVPGLPEYSATVAGRGISLWIAMQSLSQLDAVYGTKRAETLRDNMASQIYYRPANLTTAEFLEKRLGYTSAFARSKTLRHGQETGEGESEQRIPLLSAWDIQCMGDTDIIGLHRDLPPFRARRIDWRGSTKQKEPEPLRLPALPEIDEILPLPEAGSLQLPDIIDPDRRN
jgi:type IV secretion system protein VirD4